MAQLMPLPPQKPIISPHLYPDWFYLSGTGLPRLSWPLNGVVVVVVVAVVVFLLTTVLSVIILVKMAGFYQSN